MLRVKKSSGGNGQFVDCAFRLKAFNQFKDQTLYVKDNSVWKQTSLYSGGDVSNITAVSFRLAQGSAATIDYVRFGQHDVSTLKVFDFQNGVKTLIDTINLGLKTSSGYQTTTINLSPNSDTFIEVHGVLQPNPETIEAEKDAARIQFNSNASVVSIDYIDSINYKLRTYPQVNSSALVSVPQNLPASVTSLESAFSNAINFNQRLEWDTSNVKSTVNMFNNARSYNSDMSALHWDSLVKADNMFKNAQAFNKPITIDSPYLTSMSFMFCRAFALNSPVLINTSQVTSLEEVFSQTYVFNQPLPASANGKTYWVTSNVVNMVATFAGSYYFFQDISHWDTTKLADWAAFAVGTPMTSAMLPAKIAGR